MSEEKVDLEEFIDSVKDYVETRGELSKLQAIEKSSKLAGGIAVGLILFFLALIVLLFISVSLAYAVSEWIGRAYSGFLVVAGFYTLISILLYLNREKWIKQPMMNGMIRNFFKDDNVKN